jgi:hypothetical protein
MPSKKENVETAATCPFMAEPCPQGYVQGMQCQLRVSQDFDPVGRFNDFQVVYCAVCRQHVTIPAGVALAGNRSGAPKS